MACHVMRRVVSVVSLDFHVGFRHGGVPVHAITGTVQRYLRYKNRLRKRPAVLEFRLGDANDRACNGGPTVRLDSMVLIASMLFECKSPSRVRAAKLSAWA